MVILTIDKYEISIEEENQKMLETEQQTSRRSMADDVTVQRRPLIGIGFARNLKKILERFSGPRTTLAHVCLHPRV